MPRRKRVHFRVWNDRTGERVSDVIALFPDERIGPYIASYVHNGQWGEAHPDVYRMTRPARPEEAERLRQELVELFGEEWDR